MWKIANAFHQAKHRNWPWRFGPSFSAFQRALTTWSEHGLTDYLSTLLPHLRTSRISEMWISEGFLSCLCRLERLSPSRIRYNIPDRAYSDHLHKHLIPLIRIYCFKIPAAEISSFCTFRRIKRPSCAALSMINLILISMRRIRLASNRLK